MGFIVKAYPIGPGEPTSNNIAMGERGIIPTVYVRVGYRFLSDRQVTIETKMEKDTPVVVEQTLSVCTFHYEVWTKRRGGQLLHTSSPINMSFPLEEEDLVPPRKKMYSLIRKILTHERFMIESDEDKEKPQQSLSPEQETGGAEQI